MAEIKTEDEGILKKEKQSSSLFLLLHLTQIGTIHSNYRQVVFSITQDFRLDYAQYGPPEQESRFKKIFRVAPFEKNPKLIVFYLILKSEFLGLLEDLFR